MSFESALSFLIAIFIFGITPGPGVFALIARSLQRGSWSCLPLALGMIGSDVIYLVLACLGLSAVATHWEEAFTLIRIVGAIYLCYLGWKMWQAKPQLLDEADTTPKSRRRGFWQALLQGFLISASNPKVILFYIAFLPTFLDLSQLGYDGIALAVLLTFVGLLSGLMLIAFSVARARRHLSSERRVRSLNRLSGSIMTMAGVFLATRH